MDQIIVTDYQYNIVTPSFTTFTSSSYKSEEMESEGGKHPTCRKYVPSNGWVSSKVICIGERDVKQLVLRIILC